LTNKKIYVVFDTGAFLAKYHLQLDPSRTTIYTVPLVIDEVCDKENREALEIGLDIGRVIVVKPNEKYIEKVVEKALEIGEYISLSKTDIEIAALALELSRKGRVVVITDDYALQNLLLHLDIPYKPLRTTGIKSARKYVVVCKRCGYTSTNREERICPICGYELVKKSINTS